MDDAGYFGSGGITPVLQHVRRKPTGKVRGEASLDRSMNKDELLTVPDFAKRPSLRKHLVSHLLNAALRESSPESRLPTPVRLLHDPARLSTSVRFWQTLRGARCLNEYPGEWKCRSGPRTLPDARTSEPAP